MSGTRESVIRMANDIARNFAVLGEEAAVSATLEHIDLFWDPRMKETFRLGDGANLCAIAREVHASLNASRSGCMPERNG